MISLIFAAIMGLGGGSLAYHNFTAPDAYDIHPPASVITHAEPYLSLNGRVALPCTPGAGRTGVIVVIGQSLSVNSVKDANEAPVLYTATSANAHQLNIYDGKCYPAKDPLLGVNGNSGTWITRMADKLVASGKFDRVIVVPMGVGNTRADQWASETTAPYLFNIINVTALRIRDAGLSCTAVMWGQGESDTSVGTSQASYSASLAKIIGEFNRVMPGCPFLVAQEAYYYGATSPAVVAAQLAAVNGTTVFAGENVDSIPPSGRYDNTHLNEAGASQRATLAATALLAALGL